jgi:hypothetical protein
MIVVIKKVPFCLLWSLDKLVLLNERNERNERNEKKEKEGAAIGRYIRNIADIIQKCNYIRIAVIMLNRSYIRSTADITELYDIVNVMFVVMYSSKLVAIGENLIK